MCPQPETCGKRSKLPFWRTTSLLKRYLTCPQLVGSYQPFQVMFITGKFSHSRIEPQKLIRTIKQISWNFQDDDVYHKQEIRAHPSSASHAGVLKDHAIQIPTDSLYFPGFLGKTKGDDSSQPSAIAPQQHLHHFQRAGGASLS